MYALLCPLSSSRLLSLLKMQTIKAALQFCGRLGRDCIGWQELPGNVSSKVEEAICKAVSTIQRNEEEETRQLEEIESDRAASAFIKQNT